MTAFAKFEPRSVLSSAELAAVRDRSDLKGVWCVAHAWGVMLLAMAAVAWTPWPFTPLAALAAIPVIGSRQLGLAILMHDAAHGILTRSGGLNRFLGRWLCAYPILSDMDRYRGYHLQHHRRTQQADDPDLALSAAFPISTASFRRKLLRDLTGRTGYQQRRDQILTVLGPAELPARERLRRFAERLGPGLAVNAALFAGLSLAGAWWAYPLLWVLPLLTWFQVVVRVRNIAEHAVVPDNDDPFRNARTTRADGLARAFLAPYWVNYHVEHHLMMWAPCYNLPALHRLLVTRGLGEKMELQPSYAAVLAKATAGADRGPGSRRRNRSLSGIENAAA